MPSSIWDLPENQEGASSSEGKFIGSVPDGTVIEGLTFTNLTQRAQREETEEKYRTPNGMEHVFFFQDEAGNEKEISQKSAKGKFFSAMRQAQVEVGEVVSIKRQGTGVETTWIITKTKSLEGNPLA